MDNTIKLFESSEIANLQTEENIVGRLASKAARNLYADKTDRIYTLVGDATVRRAYVVASGKRKPDLKRKNIRVTMILFRGKEADPKAEQQKGKQVG